MKKISPPSIYLDVYNDEVGRGVFALRAFSKGEIIEEAPIFLIEEDFSSLPEAFKNRVFNWRYMTKTSAKHAIALGYGSMYNHCDDPNVVYKADHENNLLILIANRAIAPYEHLTVNYDQEPDISMPDEVTWFDKRGIQKLDIH